MARAGFTRSDRWHPYCGTQLLDVRASVARLSVWQSEAEGGLCVLSWCRLNLSAPRDLEGRLYVNRAPGEAD